MGKFKTREMLSGNEVQRKQFTCELCGNRFYAPRKKKYCGRECQSDAMRKVWDEDKAIRLYKEGMTLKKVASEVGVSIATVRICLWTNDIEIRGNRKSSD